MRELNDTAMSRTLQTDECVKLLHNFEGGIHMSKATNPVPIHEKLALTVKEAAAYSNIGMNLIHKPPRTPNCPFVLFMGAKSWSNIRSLTSSLVRR